MRWAVVILVAGLVVAWPWRAAEPHSWYDAACCHDRDCRPLVDGDVEERPDGYYIRSLQRRVPYGSHTVRPSQDEHFHVCTFIMHVQAPSGERSDTLQVRCLYVPAPIF